MAPQYNRQIAPWPHFDEDETNAVQRVIASGKVNYWTGEEGRNFEQEYAAFCGRKYGIALHNGTLALELALHAFGIGDGDEVITTPRTFIASASAAVMRGALPVFADVDRHSQNITAESIEAVITPRTKAIVPVHLAGWPCDMPAIMDLAKRHNLIVIEDCAQAHGAAIDGKPVGNFGHAAAFSFCQDKIITTGGEGGMLLLDDEQAWRKAWAYKDHGKSYAAVYEREHDPGFRWLHESFGTNWRMLEVQAAIGRIQLRKLAEWGATRTRNAQILTSALGGCTAVRVPQPREDMKHAYYKFYCFLEAASLKEGWSRDRIMLEIVQSGFPAFSGSCSEIYLEKAFAGTASRPESRLPVAKELGETSLMFLVHPTIPSSQMEEYAACIAAVINEAAI